MGLLDRLFTKKLNKTADEAPPAKRPLRNESCWCGSGLKYKKCHMDEDQRYLTQKKDKELSAKQSCSPVFG